MAGARAHSGFPGCPFDERLPFEDLASQADVGYEVLGPELNTGLGARVVCDEPLLDGLSSKWGMAGLVGAFSSLVGLVGGTVSLRRFVRAVGGSKAVLASPFIFVPERS